jgi:transposase
MILRQQAHWTIKAYSIDLRKKIVHSVYKGISKSEIGRRFEINRSTIQRFIKRRGEKALLRQKRDSVPVRSYKRERLLLEQDLERRPWATHRQKRKFLYGICGVEVSEAMICRTIKRRLSHSRKRDQRQQVSGTSG